MFSAATDYVISYLPTELAKPFFDRKLARFLLPEYLNVCIFALVILEGAFLKM